MNYEDLSAAATMAQFIQVLYWTFIRQGSHTLLDFHECRRRIPRKRSKMMSLVRRCHCSMGSRDASCWQSKKHEILLWHYETCKRWKPNATIRVSKYIHETLVNWGECSWTCGIAEFIDDLGGFVGWCWVHVQQQRLTCPYPVLAMICSAFARRCCRLQIVDPLVLRWTCSLPSSEIRN